MASDQPSRQGMDATKAARPAPLPAELLPAQLTAVRRREPEALAALFDMYIDRIYGLALRMLRERAGAEDVTQEVFLRVHRSCHQLDPTRDPGPWLMTITANLCRERWRTGRRRGEDRTVSLDAAPEAAATVPDTGPDPAHEAVAADRRDRLEAAIAELPEPMRLVVVLHDMEGMTHEEIAAALTETPAAIRKRYSRALHKLRESLQDVLE